MNLPVLVAYATRYGSTQELARTVARTLRSEGLSVDELPVAQVHSLAEYGAVILAAALYIGRLHRDARAFLARHQEALQQIPVVLFVPGPVDDKGRDWSGARQQLDKELARLSWLHPQAAHVVGGLWNPAAMGFPFRWIPALRNMPAKDARKWEEIHRLVHEVASKLQSETAQPAIH